MTTTVNAESRFLEVNGLRLHHVDWGNPAAPTIVCVHGFRGNAHAFDGFARRFRDRFHVLSVDVRGRGDSDWAADGVYTMDAYVSDSRRSSRRSAWRASASSAPLWAAGSACSTPAATPTNSSAS